METIDLTEVGEGCVEHPIVKLNSILRDLHRKQTEVKILANKEDLPLSVLKISLGKHGYTIVKVDIRDSIIAVEAKPIKE